MITKIKAVAAALIAIAAIITVTLHRPLIAYQTNCWAAGKTRGSGLGIRNPDSIYSLVDSEDCKGQMLISSDGWAGDYDVGKIDCRLRSVISSDAKRGRYVFDSSVAKEFCTR